MSGARRGRRGRELVFIGGTGRSGTHALAQLLGRHSALRRRADRGPLPLQQARHARPARGADHPARLPREAARLLVAPGPGRRAAARALQPAAQGRARRRRWSASRRASTPNPVAACRRLYLDLLWPLAERRGKPGLVEMSSHNVREAQTLMRLFPEARVVHALRDGRDSASSVSGKTWGPRSTRAAIGWWADRLRAIESGRPRQRGRRRLRDPRRPLPGRPPRRPGRPRPRAHLRRACSQFLGLEDEPRIRSFFEQRDDRRSGLTSAAGGATSARRRSARPGGATSGPSGALEREGNHAAPSLRAALEREAAR